MLPTIDFLNTFIGRRAVYIEGLTCCIVRVTAGAISDGFMTVTVLHENGTPVCQRKGIIRKFGDDPVESWELAAPNPPQWEVGSNGEIFSFDNDYWDGSVYGGFRLLFFPIAVERFMRKDYSGIDEFFFKE